MYNLTQACEITWSEPTYPGSPVFRMMILMKELGNIWSCKKQYFYFDAYSKSSYSFRHRYDVIFWRTSIGRKRRSCPKKSTNRSWKRKHISPSSYTKTLLKEEIENNLHLSGFFIVCFVAEPLISLLLNNSVCARIWFPLARAAERTNT